MKYINWSVAIAWMGLIFWLSSIGHFPALEDANGQRSGLLSSVTHIFLYVVLCWLTARAFLHSGIPLPRALAYGFLVTIVYGITDELHQSFVPGREAHLSDWLLDAAGAFMAVSFYSIKIKMKF